jgi:hypothetical protein
LKKQINLFDDIYQLSDKFNYGWNKNFEHNLVKRVTNPLDINNIIENILKN